MALRSVLGVDHVVVAVRELDAAAQAWRELGFTLAPKGIHSAHIGTGNYTIMLGEDYIELIGVLTETAQNEPTRAFLREREGIERTALTALDAAAGAEELRARGLTPIGPVHFNRPVELPDGAVSEARFSVFRWPLDLKPAGMRLFACQHHTRQTVWIPELQRHANGARRIVEIVLACDQPEKEARFLASLIDQPPVMEEGHGWRVRSGGGRADFLFLDGKALSKRFAPAALAGAPVSGPVALVLESADLAGTARALKGVGISQDGDIFVPASRAGGVVLQFMPQK